MPIQDIQEEVTQKTIALAVSAAKMTSRVLAQAMQVYLQSRKRKQHEIPKGKQSLADLEKQNAALSNIEITNKNIGVFTRTAKKYEIDLILSIIVGTFSSNIHTLMRSYLRNYSIAASLPWEEARHWKYISACCSNS